MLAEKNLTKTAATADIDFSLVVGRPLYNQMRRKGIGLRDLPNTGRRAIAFAAIAWIPLVGFALIQGVAFGSGVRIPLLYDYSIYARFVVALPLLIIAEAVIDPALGRAVRNFVTSGLVQETEMPEFEAALDRIAKLRDLRLVEVSLLVLAIVPVFLFVEHQRWLSADPSTWRSLSTHRLTLAGWWFALVSTPVARFIMYRWIWRLVLWTYLLYTVCRLNLHLTPTHPDFMGGLSFLPWAQARFGLLFSALGAVIVGQFANSIAYEGEKLATFKFLMLAFMAIAVVVVLAPLFLFEPKLLELKRRGLVEYGRLANRHMESFDRKWVRCTPPEGERLLGTPDISSMADLGGGYAVIREMQIVPLTRQAVIQVAVEAAVPIVVLLLVATPADKVIQTVIRMMF